MLQKKFENRLPEIKNVLRIEHFYPLIEFNLVKKKKNYHEKNHFSLRYAFVSQT